MKLKRSTFFKTLLTLSLVFCFYSTVFALDDYTVLTPLPCTTVGDINCTSPGTTATLQSYLPGAFKFAISISAVLAFIMITYGGVLYATSDAINNKSEGKGYITNAIYGLILVIGAWAILNTINPQMLQFNLNFPVPSLGGNSTTPSSVISANGLQQVTQNALIDLRSKCGATCVVNVTSTTGGSHDPQSTHYQGLAVDIAPNAQLTNYLTGSTTNPPTCTRVYKNMDGKTTMFLWETTGSKCGGQVASDGDHWHMSVTP